MTEKLNIGGVGFTVCSPYDLPVRGLLKSFLGDEKAQVQIDIILENQRDYLECQQTGEDIFCKYYRRKGELVIALKGGRNIPSAMIFCKNQMKEIRFELFEQMQSGERVLNKYFRFLPMRQILYQFDAFIFHSSRIEVNGKAVLFTGKSGVGKTTQARLWEKYRNARILCNDRTIIRKENGSWNTYGYFEDGSEPIGNNKCLPLGAIVVLEQAAENQITRINGGQAIKALVEQIFIDKWDSQMLQGSIERVIELLNDVPVFYFRCTKGELSVNTLDIKLFEGEVI